MTKYICSECGGKLVQMLEREPYDNDYDETTGQMRNQSKHYGFYCKTCKQMYKEKFSLIKDEIILGEEW